MPVKLFQDCDYGGSVLSLSPGLNNLRVADWSAITVDAGEQVTLYSQRDGMGKKKTFSGPVSVPCFWYLNFEGHAHSSAVNSVGNMNDIIYSYRYTPRPGVTPPPPPSPTPAPTPSPLEIKLADAMNLLQQREQTISTLQNQLKEVTALLEKEKSEKSQDIVAEMTALHNKITQMRQENDRLQNQINQQIELYTNKTNLSEAELQNVTILLKQQEFMIFTLQDQKKGIQQQLIQTTAALASMKADLSESYDIRNTLEAQIGQNVQSINDMQNSITRISEQNDILRKTIDEQTATYAEKVKVMEDEKTHLKNLYDRLSEEYAMSRETIKRLEDVNSESLAAFESQKKMLEEKINEVAEQYRKKSAIMVHAQAPVQQQVHTIYIFVDSKSWDERGLLRVLSVAPDGKNVMLSNYESKNMAGAWIVGPGGYIISLAAGQPLYLDTSKCQTLTMSYRKNAWIFEKQAKHELLFRLKSNECNAFIEAKNGSAVSLSNGFDAAAGFYMMSVGTVRTTI